MFSALVATLLSIVVLGGCVSEIGLKAYVSDVNPRLWRRAAVVEIDNSDTTTLRNIAIVVRHQPHQRIDSLSVWITTQTPDSISFAEQVTLHIGKRRHRRIGATITELIPYRRNVVWDRLGNYIINIHPTKPTKGIEAIGVRIDGVEREMKDGQR